MGPRWLPLLLLLALPPAGRAAEPNPFAAQCDRLATVDATAPLFRTFATGGFWRDRAMGTAFIAARDTGRAPSAAAAAGDARVEEHAAIALAAIVRRDVPLLRANVDPAVRAYFRRTGMTVLTTAAACNFADGARYLLDTGEDPNAGVDVGAFNLALVYGNDAMAADLLRHGYRINADARRCRASQFIATRRDVEPALRARILTLQCLVESGATSE